MRVLCAAFSARREGNCSKLATYCLDRFKQHGFGAEIVKASEVQIGGCSHCAYECFADKKCPIEDSVRDIYRKCDDADILIFAVPTYGGHLSSLYFAFAERAQAIFRDTQEYTAKLLKKVNFIIIGNLSAGGDMALHEALYGFANLDFWPETLLFAAREHGKSSVRGDLIDVPEVKRRLDGFVDMIVRNSSKQQLGSPDTG